MRNTLKSKNEENKTGWIVTISGFGVNMALGVLYSWSVFADALRTNGWTATQTQIPYMLACAVFAVLMVPAGRTQDKFGPKPVLVAASVCTGAAFILSGVFHTLAGLILCFGVIFGAGMALGYATTTPTAIKWFDARQRGLISGIVVSGFGLAGIYVAPLTTFLLHAFSLEWAFIILGAFYCLLIFLLHFLIRNPPAGYTPASISSVTTKQKLKTALQDYTARQMLKTRQFYMLWIIFFCGTFAGLKMLGQLSSIGKEQAVLSPQGASLLVIVYAVFNCIGRFLCGILSDKLGRRMILFAIFAIQVVVFLFFSQFNTLATLSIGTAFIAFSFGGMLSLFPSMAADFFGVKNLGLNYGIIFTAWGAGGVLGPLLGGLVRDHIGVFDVGYLISVAVCVVGLVLSFFATVPVQKASGDLSADRS